MGSGQLLSFFTADTSQRKVSEYTANCLTINLPSVFNIKLHNKFTTFCFENPLDTWDFWFRYFGTVWELLYTAALFSIQVSTGVAKNIDFSICIDNEISETVPNFQYSFPAVSIHQYLLQLNSVGVTGPEFQYNCTHSRRFRANTHSEEKKSRLSNSLRADNYG